MARSSVLGGCCAKKKFPTTIFWDRPRRTGMMFVGLCSFVFAQLTALQPRDPSFVSKKEDRRCWDWPWPVFRELFREFGGYFEEKNVVRNMRNIVSNRAKFISFWAPEKNFTRNVASPREIFLRGVGHVPLAVPVLLHSHPFSVLIHIISPYGSHFAIYHTQLNVHCYKYWFLVSRCRKILRNAFWAMRNARFFLYKTKLITKFGSFWSEIRIEIWSISNEIQAKANVWLEDIRGFLGDGKTFKL